MFSKKLKSLFADGKNTLPICIAGFMHSGSIAAYFVAIPFILKRLGGSDTDLGVSLGFYFTAYPICCLLASKFLDRFNPKHSVQLGAFAIICSFAALAAIIILDQKQLCPINPVTLTIFISGFIGITTSMFWPPLMGWLTAGSEGRQLNRKLGLFSTTVALGGTMTPFFAGLLVENSSLAPVIAMIALTSIALIAISYAKKTGPNTIHSIDINQDTDCQKNVPAFIIMARIALFTSFMCMGVIRSQLAYWFKFELLFSESDFGLTILAMSAAMLITLNFAGRTHLWHYKFLPFISIQVLLLICMFFITAANSLLIITCIVMLIGIGRSFIYASHLYYGASGAKKRSGAMAIHETILSMGFASGSILGGLLSDNIGRSSPYYFGFAIVTAGLLAQVIIWASVTRKTAKVTDRSETAESWEGTSEGHGRRYDRA
ncbi:MAG: MFS transporter [Planctomycetes bacterium]|nr:MFS transporter [Planctomycetota bacterium]MBL7106713.1 MFS transporter [Phycisphaerae bacterium]